MLVDRPSNAFSLIKDQEIERNIFEKIYNRDQATIDDRVLNQGRVEKMLQLHQESTSSELGQRLTNKTGSASSPKSRVRSSSIVDAPQEMISNEEESQKMDL